MSFSSSSSSSFQSVLFLCVANAARSQMAEGLARIFFGDAVRVQSAGSRPSHVHPIAVAVMQERGVDISSHTSKSVDIIDPASVDLVITLCAEEVCPVFLSPAPRLHWPLPDPDDKGTVADENERRQRFRTTRDELERRIAALKARHDAGLPPS